MSNKSGKAYCLTTLCPIKDYSRENVSAVFYTRKVLQNLPLNEDSPLARVPNTYLARFFILDDTIYQGHPYKLDTLQSRYLVFTANFHGELEPYVLGMYKAIAYEIHRIWKYCTGFDKVSDPQSFLEYIRKCQVTSNFHFVGSTDDSLEEQLKSLYLKQEFSKFVFANQGLPPAALLGEYKKFVKRTKPSVLAGPTWIAGASSLDKAVKGEEVLKTQQPFS